MFAAANGQLNETVQAGNRWGGCHGGRWRGKQVLAPRVLQCQRAWLWVDVCGDVSPRLSLGALQLSLHFRVTSGDRALIIK
jgi:hypothetical protein